MRLRRLTLLASRMGAAIRAPRQMIDHKQARPGPPPIEDLRHINAMAKLVHGRRQLDELLAEQKRQHYAKWDEIYAMPPPLEEVAAPALEDDASESLALAGPTARLAFSAHAAASAAPNTYVAGIESFQSKEGALFDAKDDDGRGGGVFVLSEQNVSRPVSFAVPVVLTAERAEDEAGEEAGADDDEEMPDLEDSGARTENKPMIMLPRSVVHVVVYLSLIHL